MFGDYSDSFVPPGGNPPGDDRLFGGSGRDRLDGEVGNDRLNGNRGNDNLNGHSGDNTNDGGPGVDSCLNPDAAGGALNCEN
jgi:Ca2+-binding RTX toxin-like protein